MRSFAFKANQLSEGTARIQAQTRISDMAVQYLRHLRHRDGTLWDQVGAERDKTIHMPYENNSFLPLNYQLREYILKCLAVTNILSAAPEVVADLNDEVRVCWCRETCVEYKYVFYYVSQSILLQNPIIVRAAAVALEKMLGTQEATSKVVEAATSAPSKDMYEVLSNALRFMKNREQVVSRLESIMNAGNGLGGDIQDVARMLMSELGGTTAMQKLTERSTMRNLYNDQIKGADEKV